MDFKEKLLEIMKSRPRDMYSVKRFKEILEITDIFGENQIANALEDLANLGEIYGDKRGKYMLCNELGYVKGVIAGNPKGFAFLRPSEEGVKDYFIPGRNLNGACHGDTVLISRDMSDMAGDVGYVIKILERGVKQIVGTYQDNRTCGFVISDDKKYFNDVYISKPNSMRAQHGMKVVVNITNYTQRNPEGKVVEILGRAGEKGVDVMSIIRAHGIKDYFDDSTLREANALPDKVLDSQKIGRTDFTLDNVFTIDGDDSKDFDDAVCISKDKNGNYVLSVHIADVSEYVKENSALDKEAIARGTSVYFVDKVVPMLPEKLSNGICSLNEGVERLTLSCTMKINGKGEVIDSVVEKGVICSKRRMTYDKVSKALAGDENAVKEYSPFISDLKLMEELANILIKKREKEGAIDFETHEAKIKLDKNGKAIDVVPYERGFSNRIIEEFMILANCTVAEKLYFPEYPCIYRVHEKPTDEKMAAFAQFVNGIGIPWRAPVNDIHSKNLASLLTKLTGSMLYLIVNKVMLRSMQKAKYSPVCSGHFGLSANVYCHFTSPIRRYPDLFVHRMIKKMLNAEFDQKAIEHYDELAEEYSKHCSEAERRAEEAEREVEDIKKAEYLANHLGEEFDGVISGVANFGLFVELENSCEGLVKVETLESGLIYNDKMYALTNGTTTYTLGQKVRIKVAACDVAGKRVLFYIVK